MEWYKWILSGIALVILEVMTPALVSIFFGLAAIIVGVMVAIWPTAPEALQFILFGILSVIFLFLLRRVFSRAFTGRRSKVSDGLADEYVGLRVKVISAIRHNEEGKVELYGAPWRAIADEQIETGTMVEIVSRENLTLKVRRLP
jgi:hypothetical protein